MILTKYILKDFIQHIYAYHLLFRAIIKNTLTLHLTIYKD